MKSLPIYEVIPKIKEILSKKQNLIIQASTGAGKSTVVPIELLKEKWLKNKKILVLEPRRVAARAVASQMAKLLGENLGESIGYQIKMESVQSKDTKVLVVTEGILTKMLQDDQGLDSIACIIFDEFHERSIHTDLGLALALQCQEMLREDLKLVLMSATINTQEIKTLFDEVDIVKSDGFMYEVKEYYLEESIKHPNIKEVENILYEKILASIKNDQGDILVFCEGVKTINSLKEKLENKVNDVLILPLHSNLNKQEQDQAINKNAKRKVILSTNIAQTSLTIQGIKVVIDSGLHKTSLYDEKSGLDILKTSFISEDSARQRQGRAGRIEEGKCYKLWHKKRILKESIRPEILRVDISSFLLNAYKWGVELIGELKLLDYPKEDVLKSANSLLYNLELIDERNSITSMGEKVLALGVNTRLALMILKANELGFASQACLMASIIENKTSFILNSFDFVDEWHYIQNNNSFKIKQIKQQALFYEKKLEKLIEVKENKFDEKYLGILLLFAYSDRLAKKSSSNENVYNLSNKKQAKFIKENSFKDEYIVVSNLISSQDKHSYIQKACSINIKEVRKYFPTHFKTSIYLQTKPKLQFKEIELFEQLIIEEKNINKVSKELLHEAIYSYIKEQGLENVFDLKEKKSKQLLEKIEFYNRSKDMSLDLKAYSLNNLSKNPKGYLELYLNKVEKFEDLKNIDFYTVLCSLIPWQTIKDLDELLPDTIKVPSGSNIRLEYSFDEVLLKVKIQEVFGLKETPKILNNTLLLSLHLLSPALRPIQITKDLKSFWENSYAEVRAELRGKYKKHYWPENPFEAIATSKTKKNM